MSTKLLKLPALASAAVIVGALTGAAVLGSASAQPSHHAAVHAAKRHHHHARHRVHRGIPQHNGGDHDSDNRGGPTDGDGNV